MAPGKPGDLLTASNVDKDIRSHAADSRRVSNGDSGFILTSAVLVQVRITPKIASKEFGQEVFELYFQHRQGDRQPMSQIRPHYQCFPGYRGQLPELPGALYEFG